MRLCCSLVLDCVRPPADQSNALVGIIHWLKSVLHVRSWLEFGSKSRKSGPYWNCLNIFLHLRLFPFAVTARRMGTWQSLVWTNVATIIGTVLSGPQKLRHTVCLPSLNSYQFCFGYFSWCHFDLQDSFGLLCLVWDGEVQIIRKQNRND